MIRVTIPLPTSHPNLKSTSTPTFDLAFYLNAQVILETLSDMLAEPALLADLFYNYDCDTQVGVLTDPLP